MRRMNTAGGASGKAVGGFLLGGRGRLSGGVIPDDTAAGRKHQPLLGASTDHHCFDDRRRDERRSGHPVHQEIGPGTTARVTFGHKKLGGGQRGKCQIAMCIFFDLFSLGVVVVDRAEGDGLCGAGIPNAQGNRQEETLPISVVDV